MSTHRNRLPKSPCMAQANTPERIVGGSRSASIMGERKLYKKDLQMVIGKAMFVDPPRRDLRLRVNLPAMVFMIANALSLNYSRSFWVPLT